MCLHKQHILPSPTKVYLTNCINCIMKNNNNNKMLVFRCLLHQLIKSLTLCSFTCCTRLSGWKELNRQAAKSYKTIWPCVVAAFGPLFPSASHCLVSKGLGGVGGGLYVHQNIFSLSKHTLRHSPIHASTKSHYQCHYNSTHNASVFSLLKVSAKVHT